MRLKTVFPPESKLTYEDFRYLQWNYLFEIDNEENEDERERLEKEFNEELEKLGATREDFSKCYKYLWDF